MKSDRIAMVILVIVLSIIISMNIISISQNKNVSNGISIPHIPNPNLINIIEKYDQSNEKDSVNAPFDNETVDYNRYVCDKKNEISDLHILGNYGGKYGDNYSDEIGKLKCNESIVNNYKHGSIPLSQTQTMCHISQIADPSLYYRKYYSYPKNDLEGEKQRGYNYSIFTGYSNINDIGKITLDKTRNFPVASNFAFNNTPSRKFD